MAQSRSFHWTTTVCKPISATVMPIPPRLTSLAFTWYRALQHRSRGYASAKPIFFFYMQTTVRGYGMSRLLSSGGPWTSKKRKTCSLKEAGQNCLWRCAVPRVSYQLFLRSLRDPPSLGNATTTLSVPSPDSCMSRLSPLAPKLFREN